jgi:predicted ATPase
MSISELNISGYRSIREIQLPFERVNVLTGPNGCGKSNLYRSLYLLTMAANGMLARTIADEGGMPSALWAGARTKGPVRMTIGTTLDLLQYELICGLIPQEPNPDAPYPFLLDPQVKEENVWFISGKSRQVLLERGTGTAMLRDSEGNRTKFPLTFSETESILSQLKEPHRYPQLSSLHQEIKQWRFYHHFRTDADAPLRHPQVGVFTPVLSHNGDDLAAALMSILVLDGTALHESVEYAFPNSELLVNADKGRFSYGLKTAGINRPLDARELSDGTVRYLCLLAALLSPRPPSLLALNEPESSLHPDLLEPLARLIVQASHSSQIWITTHSSALADYIESYSGIAPVRLEKINGATCLVEY